MSEIIINESSSDRNLPLLKRFCSDDWKLKEVSISYNCSTGLPPNDDYEHYPFKAVFEAYYGNIVILIYSLTVGYCGSGPTDLSKVLDFLGVHYSEDDIFTKAKEDENGFINLKYEC